MNQLSMPTFKLAQLRVERGEARVSTWLCVLNLICMRLLDLALIVLATPLLLPLCLLIALAIRLDSRGPALFIQERVGALPTIQNGQLVWKVTPFRMMKFRSMIHNADESLHREHIKRYVQGTLRVGEDADAAMKIARDPRITRMGHLLRKSSLDELPQLINVLRGEMSLVGPRPVPLYEVAEYEEWHYKRLAAYPGLTGQWQLDGRGESSFEEMIQMDIAYVKQQSLWLNLKILALTPWAVLSGRGAA